MGIKGWDGNGRIYERGGRRWEGYMGREKI